MEKKKLKLAVYDPKKHGEVKPKKISILEDIIFCSQCGEKPEKGKKLIEYNDLMYCIECLPDDYKEDHNEFYKNINNDINHPELNEDYPAELDDDFEKYLNGDE